MSIPKVIAYCWFGFGRKSDKVKRCIDSWATTNPDYSVIELNEANCNISAIPWTTQAYNKGAWAFVADYFRMDYMYRNGGITLDADVELLKSLDPYLSHQFFSGQEVNDKVLITATMGSVQYHHFLAMILHYYQSMTVFQPIPNTAFITKLIKVFPLTKNNFTLSFPGGILYPQHIFCPFNHKTRQIPIHKDTVAIHHFNGSWKPS